MGNVRDTQDYLAYLRHDQRWVLPAFAITGVADEATAAVVLAFQRIHNEACGASIHEDGMLGEQTLGAIFDVARQDLLARPRPGAPRSS